MEKRSIKHRILLALTLLGTRGLASVAASSPPDSSEWRTYGGNSAGDRYSGLSQIKPSNAHRLKPVWRLDTGPGGLLTTPLMSATRSTL